MTSMVLAPSPPILVKFYVDPDELKNAVYIKHPVKLVITNIDNDIIRSLLGDTGLKLAERGLSFYFERDIAEQLINNSCAMYIV